MTKLEKQLQLKCIDCSGSKPEVAKCQETDCPLYPDRMGRAGGSFNLGEAIKKYCAWCGPESCFDDCPLYPTH